MNNSFSIKVPASTANLGPGFDSLGLALSLYLTLEVELSDVWNFSFTSPELHGLPSDETNLICQVANQVSRLYHSSLSPCKVKVHSTIPVARGLGSSASAIVAGIELANHLCDLRLTQKEKLQIATRLEGHPDNVGASIFGGLVVGCYHQNEVQLLSFTNLGFEVVALIPKTILLTKESRQVLPKELPFSYAVEASSIANLMVAALLSENWFVAGEMMRKDLFHQPFRKKLIPDYDKLEHLALKNGAFGVALSGAGPTLLAFTERNQGAKLERELKSCLPELDIRHLPIDRSGSCVF